MVVEKTFCSWNTVLLAVILISMTDVTHILSQIDQGDPTAPEQLLPLVYGELRRLAEVRMSSEKPGQTLQATALVHEAYLRLVGGQASRDWNSRGHFFSAAAEAMRRILIDNARRRRRPKHGGELNRIDFDEELVVVSSGRANQLLALGEALDKLAEEAPQKAELVKLRYFAGLSHQDAANVLGISRTTADRYWTYAKAFLYSEMRGWTGEKSSKISPED